MNRPDRIKVDRDEVVIKWDQRVKKTADGYPAGATYRSNTVEIDKYGRSASKREWLMHELLHKLWEAGGLGERYATTTEEYIITVLSGQLVDMLRDNPELVEFLTEGD